MKYGDLIDRQAAVDAVAKGLKGVFVEYQDVAEKLLNNVPSVQPEPPEDICGECDAWNKYKSEIKALPSAQPEHTETHSCDCERTETHESRREWYMKGYRDAQAVSCTDLCVDCPLFDHEKHECPRFNRVIPRAIEEVTPRWIPVTPDSPPLYMPVLTWDGGTRHVEQRIPYIRDEYGEKIISDWWIDGDEKWDEWAEYQPNLRDGCAIKWMPLPEPYAERGQDDT